MAPDKDLKLNFDTSPDEIISPDKNCSICYGKGKTMVANPISAMTTGRLYIEKECPCIANQRAELAASMSLSNIFKGKGVVTINREDGTLKVIVKDKQAKKK